MNNVRKFNNEETVTLQSIVSVNGTSRMEVLKGLKAHRSTLKGHPGAILGQAIKAGLIKKEIVGSDITYYFINNEKGGENHICTYTDQKPEGQCMEYCKMEQKLNILPSEDGFNYKKIDDDIKYLIKNNYVYHDCKIDGKEVWGIGKNAITLVDKVVYDYSCHHKRGYNGEKTFHRFKEGKVQNKNSFNNGIEIAKKIIDEYGRL